MSARYSRTTIAVPGKQVTILITTALTTTTHRSQLRTIRIRTGSTQAMTLAGRSQDIITNLPNTLTHTSFER